jgi:hypothetical protein
MGNKGEKGKACVFGKWKVVPIVVLVANAILIGLALLL